MYTLKAMQVVLPPRNHGDSGVTDDDDTSSNSNDTVDNVMDDTKEIDNTEIEMMQSEGLESESKEEEIEESQSQSKRSKARGVHSEYDDLNDCEFLLNVQVWHTKLVDELYPHLKQKKKKNHRKQSSGGMKGLFGF